MNVVTLAESQRNLGEIIDRTVEDADITVIAQPDGMSAVIMSAATFTGWRETLYLLKSPANTDHLARSIAQLRGGFHPLRGMMR
jgi:antitoxin YefM